MAQWKFAFFAFANQSGKLGQGFVTADSLYIVVFVEYGMCSWDGDLPFVFVAGDYCTVMARALICIKVRPKTTGLVTR